MKTKANDGKVYKIPDDPVWRNGPPPEEGWWPASSGGEPRCLRWYTKANDQWSRPAYPNNTAVEAGIIANIPTAWQEEIKWANRWWLK